MKNSLNFVPEIQMNIDCFIGRCGSYVIENENDIEKACEYYFDQIISFGLPYFLKYSTYENIFQLIFGSENISKYHYFDPYSRFVLLGLLNKMLNFGENLLITFDLIEKNAKNLLDSDKFNQILEVKNEIIELELEAPVLSTSTQDRLFGDVQDEQLLNS